MIPLTQWSRWVVGADGGTCLGCAFHLETNGWSAEQTFSRHQQASAYQPCAGGMALARPRPRPRSSHTHRFWFGSAPPHSARLTCAAHRTHASGGSEHGGRGHTCPSSSATAKCRSRSVLRPTTCAQPPARRSSANRPAARACSAADVRAGGVGAPAARKVFANEATDRVGAAQAGRVPVQMWKK